VPRSDGTVAVTPKPLGTTTGVYEQVGANAWREVGGDAVLATRTDGGDDATVSAISWGASFTLLRAPVWGTASLVLPTVALSVVVLLVSLVAWPAVAVAGAGRRRRGELPATAPADAAARRGRRTLLLSRLGQLATVVALVGWALVAVQALSFVDVPAVSLRVLQGLQVVGVLAVVPAVLATWQAVRDRRGALVVTGRVLVVLALVALAWFALAYRLISPSVSY